MLRRAMLHRWTVLALSLIAIAAVAIPVYAHCGKCPASAKAIGEGLNKTKMTVAAATTLAEVATKGTALQASSHVHDDNVVIHVHCLVEGKIMEVDVDAKTGKAGEPKEVKSL